MKHTFITGITSLSLLLPLAAQEAPAKEAKKTEQQELAAKNALAAEKLKAELSEMNAELSRIKLQKEILAEKLSLATLKLRTADQEAAALRMAAKSKASEEVAVAKAKAESLTSQLKAEQAELQLELAKIKKDLTLRQAKNKQKMAASREPEYLENPLKEDGTLVISDRRIAFNGAVTYDTADYITERLSFYNNADSTKPIFIVIDYSPGGSVMAGYRILKAMEGSKAPVYVVVKSFAASMAAAITTLAEQSYAYPNAIILHHQMSSSFGRMNMTEQKEAVERNQKWWKRLAKPIADKMGISMEEMVAQMYENASDGDWSEFGTEAQKLKWVDHIVENIEETSILTSPDYKKEKKKEAMNGLTETLDEDGRPVMYLPRLKAEDAYWIDNDDQYYKLR